MLRRFLRAKIHHATVTQTDLDYVGSITIDEDLLRAAGILPNESVAIADLDNGARFETYVFRGEPGSGIIGINGAAARLVDTGHRIIIFAYADLTEDEIDAHAANVIVLDRHNRVAKTMSYPTAIAQPLPL